jgi:hypothetical protein
MPSTPHRQQEQQPGRPDNRQQQQGASAPDFQAKAPRQQSQSDTAKGDKQMGEGSYEATEDYQKGIKSYLDKADVKSDAEAAKPASQQEADEMKKAEDAGLSHTKAPGK